MRTCTRTALPEDLANPLSLRVGERAAGNSTVKKDADKSNKSLNESRLRCFFSCFHRFGHENTQEVRARN